MNEQLPDWVVENDRAYLVSYTMQAGVGSFPSAKPVRVMKVQAAWVIVEGLNDGLTYKVSRRSLTIRDSGGRYSSDTRLASATDPDVAKAKRLARTVNALPGGDQWQAALRVIEHHSYARIAEDMPAQLDAMIAALTAIEAEARAALGVLRSIRSTI